MQGFYTVYREVFDRLAKQESEAAQSEGKPAQSSASGFGTSSSAWQEVSAFYQRWLHFVSERDFAWADVHNLASAPNRKAGFAHPSDLTPDSFARRLVGKRHQNCKTCTLAPHIAPEVP